MLLISCAARRASGGRADRDGREVAVADHGTLGPRPDVRKDPRGRHEVQYCG
jgi:hypothetical protein